MLRRERERKRDQSHSLKLPVVFGKINLDTLSLTIEKIIMASTSSAEVREYPDCFDFSSNFELNGDDDDGNDDDDDDDGDAIRFLSLEWKETQIFFEDLRRQN